MTSALRMLPLGVRAMLAGTFLTTALEPQGATPAQRAISVVLATPVVVGQTRYHDGPLLLSLARATLLRVGRATVYVGRGPMDATWVLITASRQDEKGNWLIDVVARGADQPTTRSRSTGAVAIAVETALCRAVQGACSR